MSLRLPSRLSSIVEEQLGQLRVELGRNTRLRMGLAAIAAILGTYGLLQWNEAVGAHSKELDKLNRAISRLRASEGAGPLWRERAGEAKKLRQRFDGRIWTAPSLGRAQAAFQDWAGEKLATMHAQHAQITQINDAASGEKFGEGEPVPMKLSVSFDFSSIVLENFLAGIYMSGHNVRVDSLLASRTKRKIEIVMVAWTAPGPDTIPTPTEQGAPVADDVLLRLPGAVQ
jgi:hypothetical protein